MPQNSLTEAQIQDRLYVWSQHLKHPVALPNVYLGTSEADFISVTKAGLLMEVEIKVWRGDWLRELDAMVQSEPARFRQACMDVSAGKSMTFEESRRNRRISTAKWCKHNHMQQAYSEHHHPGPGVPNYYWVAALTGVIRDEDLERVPEYVGIIDVVREPTHRLLSSLKVRRKAKIIHHEKVKDRTMVKLARGIQFRYWEKRVNASSGS